MNFGSHLIIHNQQREPPKLHRQKGYYEKHIKTKKQYFTEGGSIPFHNNKRGSSFGSYIAPAKINTIPSTSDTTEPEILPSPTTSGIVLKRKTDKELSFGERLNEMKKI